MSCPESFTISPRGRQGIGVIQPQSGLDYPLVSPSADIRYLIADMYFEYDDPGFYDTTIPIAQHPLKIEWLYGVGCEESPAISGMPLPTHTADILITDANNNVVFDSTDLGEEAGYQRFSVKDWGDDYKLYEWLSPTAVCRIVVYKSWSPDESSPVNYSTNLAPVSAIIDARAIYKMPKRVKSLRVLNTTMRRTPVIFQAGYNMRISTGAPEVVGLRNRTEITYDVNAGDGFGQYSDCADEKPKYIYSINGVGPNKYGDFFLTGDKCIFVRTPTLANEMGGVTEQLTDDARGLKVGSDCPPCCACEDYVETAVYMNKLRNQYSRVGARSHQVKLLHEDNIDRWLEQRTCRLNKPLRLTLSPLSCPYMEVIMQFCNQCPECVEDVVLSVTLESFPGEAIGEIVPGYTTINAPGMSNETFGVSGGWPTFNARIGFVDKGASVFVKFTLKFAPRTFSYSITGTLTGTIGGQPIKPCDPNYGKDEIAESVDTRALYCNTVGCTDAFEPPTLNKIELLYPPDSPLSIPNNCGASGTCMAVLKSWFIKNTATGLFEQHTQFNQFASASNDEIVKYRWTRTDSAAQKIVPVTVDELRVGSSADTPVSVTGPVIYFPPPYIQALKNQTNYQNFNIELFAKNHKPRSANIGMPAVISATCTRTTDNNDPPSVTYAANITVAYLQTPETGGNQLVWVEKDIEETISYVDVNPDAARLYQWQYTDATNYNQITIGQYGERRNTASWFNLIDADLAVAGSRTKTLQLLPTYTGAHPNRKYRLLIKGWFGNCIGANCSGDGWLDNGAYYADHVLFADD